MDRCRLYYFNVSELNRWPARCSCAVSDQVKKKCRKIAIAYASSSTTTTLYASSYLSNICNGNGEKGGTVVCLVQLLGGGTKKGASDKDEKAPDLHVTRWSACFKRTSGWGNAYERPIVKITARPRMRLIASA